MFDEVAVLVSVVEVGVADPEAGVDADEAVPVEVMVTSYEVTLSVSVWYHSPPAPTEHVAILPSCVQTFTAVCPDRSASTLTVDGAWMTVTASGRSQVVVTESAQVITYVVVSDCWEDLLVGSKGHIACTKVRRHGGGDTLIQ